MKWPSGMEPEDVAVYARNEIEIAAAPQRVWRWLIGAERWPKWYGNCASFRFIDGPEGQRAPDLAPGRAFEWRTFGARVRSPCGYSSPFVNSDGTRARPGFTPITDGCWSRVAWDAG